MDSDNQRLHTRTQSVGSNHCEQERVAESQANGGKNSRPHEYGTIYKPDDDSSESTLVSSGSTRWDKICYACCPCAPDWVREEFPELFSLAWSMIVLSLFSFLFGPVSLAFCGHLGTDILAGVAMAGTVFNVTGVSIGAGLSTACDTCFSQSFGSVNKKMVGIYLIRGMMIILLFIFPCWAIHINAELILVAMGQDREIARIAGEYITWMMPALPAIFVQEIMLQYLRCQNILLPTVIIGAIGIGTCALTHYLFLYVFDFGYIGSAVSQLISFYLMAILLVLYTLISKVFKPTWGGWTVDVFYDWGVFLKMAMAGLLMVGLEWWSFEIGTVLAGLLGSVPLGAQSIAFQVASMAYMLPLGVGLACNIRVGQMLGSESHGRAWQVTKLGLIMIVCSSLFMASFIAAASSVIPYVFSSDIEVIRYATNVILMVALFEFFDSIAGVCAGILRGCGRQGIGAGIILACYYIIGLPVGISLMFLTSLEVLGLYVGLTVGLVIESTVFFIVVYKTDWQGEVQKAQVRAGTADMTEDEKQALLDGNDDVFRGRDEVKEAEEERIAFANEDKPRRRKRTHSVIHSPYVSSSEVNLLDQSRYSEKPTGKQVIFQRMIFVLGMILTFAAGLCVRFFIPIQDHWSELCIPQNTTNSPLLNTTLPYCNYTSVINTTTASHVTSTISAAISSTTFMNTTVTP
ncbi:multidrug and toxin extrusion protein 1-like [Lineus longissimus]|uniref:multidrug and toxin extrusion protein 1-like n=1 Tax=Lineus longissimus TaxID=88925 RepID=UPI002B4EDC2A